MFDVIMFINSYCCICLHLIEDIGSCRENICHIVKAPAHVPWKIRKLAIDVAHKAVSSLEGAGVFAVELFLTKDGQVVLVIQTVRFSLQCISLFSVSGTYCL